MDEVERPDISESDSAEEFRRWYWLKAELISYCKNEGLSPTGSKFEIADRIAHYLETGQSLLPECKQKKKATSRFDWSKEPLTLNG